MADEMDLAALAAGEKDLVQGDFRQANLVGEDLSNRDFTRAQFDKGNLQRSNLSKSVLSEASFTQADLSHANLEGCTGRSNWVHTKLTSANLRNVKFAQSNFHTCDFRDADIRGADFSKANLIHDNDFNGVIANDATKFDGARILRPMARLSIFANYRLERGELKRIAGNEGATCRPLLRRSKVPCAIWRSRMTCNQNTAVSVTITPRLKIVWVPMKLKTVSKHLRPSEAKF